MPPIFEDDIKRHGAGCSAGTTGCWEHILQDKLKDLLRTKLANRSIKSEDTTVVVSVTARSVHDLTMRFNDTTTVLDLY